MSSPSSESVPLPPLRPRLRPFKAGPRPRARRQSAFLQERGPGGLPYQAEASTQPPPCLVRGQGLRELTPPFLVIGAGGEHVDAVWEMQNLLRVERRGDKYK